MCARNPIEEIPGLKPQSAIASGLHRSTIDFESQALMTSTSLDEKPELSLALLLGARPKVASFDSGETLVVREST